MGKGDKKKAASAAQAAELLVQHAGKSSPGELDQASKFSFGARFVSQVVKESVQEPQKLRDFGQPAATAPPASLVYPPVALQPALAAHVSHLRRDDSRTRHKALLHLKFWVEEGNNGQELLEFWSKYSKLALLDQSRNVRSAACLFTATLAKNVGKKMGSIIRNVFPSLFFAQFDDSEEVSSAAQKCISDMFPARKMAEVHILCCDQILQEWKLIQEACPKDLGDPRKETAEEMKERYHRVSRECLQGITSLLASDFLDECMSNFVAGTKGILQLSSFRSNSMSSEDRTVRLASYCLLEAFFIDSGRKEGFSEDMCNMVVHSLHDPEPSNQSASLGMLIVFGRDFPYFWNHIDMGETFLPGLRNLLTHALKSNEAKPVLDSLLPLVSVMPASVLTDSMSCRILETLMNTHIQCNHNYCDDVRKSSTECTLFFIIHRSEAKFDRIVEFYCHIWDDLLHTTNNENDDSCSLLWIVTLLDALYTTYEAKNETLRFREALWMEYSDRLAKAVRGDSGSKGFDLLAKLCTLSGTSLPGLQEFIVREATVNWDDEDWKGDNVSILVVSLNNLHERVMGQSCENKEKGQVTSKDPHGTWTSLDDTINHLHDRLFKSLGDGNDGAILKCLAFCILHSQDPAMVLYADLKFLLVNRSEDQSCLLIQSLFDYHMSNAASFRLISANLDAICTVPRLLESTQTSLGTLSCLLIGPEDKPSLISVKRAWNLFEDLLALSKKETSIEMRYDFLSTGYKLFKVLKDADEHLDLCEQYLSLLLSAVWCELLLECNEFDISEESSWRHVLLNMDEARLTRNVSKSPLYHEFFAESQSSPSKISSSLLHEISEVIDFGHEQPMEYRPRHHSSATSAIIIFYLDLVQEYDKWSIQALEDLQPLFRTYCGLFEDVYDMCGFRMVKHMFNSSSGLDILRHIIYGMHNGNQDEKLLELLGDIYGEPRLYSNLMSCSCWYEPGDGSRQWQREALSLVLYRGLSSPHATWREMSTRWLRHNMTGTMPVETFKALRGVFYILRQDRGMFDASGLCTLTQSIIQILVSSAEPNENDVSKLMLCLPFPKHVMSDTFDLLQKGTEVWYFSQPAGWEEATIVSRDDTIRPPSFVIKLHESERETEGYRLQVRSVSGFQVKPRLQVFGQFTVPGDLVIDESEVEDLAAFFQQIMHDEQYQSMYGASFLRIAALTLKFSQNYLGLKEKEKCISSISNGLTAAAEWLLDEVQVMADSSKRMIQDVLLIELQEFSEAVTFLESLHLKLAPTLLASTKVQNVLNSAHSHSVALWDGFVSEHQAIESVLQCLYTAECERGLAGRICLGKSVDVRVCEIFAVCACLVRVMDASRQEAATGTHSRMVQHQAEGSIWTEICAATSQVMRRYGSILGDMSPVLLGPGFDFCSNVLHLCLTTTNGLPGQTDVCYPRLVAFDCIARNTHVLESVWNPSTETFYEILDSWASRSQPRKLEGSEREVANQLSECGMDIRLANAISDQSSPSYDAAWSLLFLYLSNREISKARKDMLRMLFKDRGIVSHNYLRHLSGLLTDSSGAMTLEVEDESSLRDSLKRIIMYLNDPLAPGSREDAKFDFPVEVVLLSMLFNFPVVSRIWYSEIDSKIIKSRITNFAKEYISPVIMDAEFGGLSGNTDQGCSQTSQDFKIRPLRSKRKLVATLEIEDGYSIDLSICFPREFPLRPPTAQLDMVVGVSEAKARKWLLSITAFLINCNGTLNEVVDLWKKNVSKEFEGHEDCLICYSIIQPSTGQLPRLECTTCHQKFHGTCLYKWFNSSSKSNCPHCQSPW